MKPLKVSLLAMLGLLSLQGFLPAASRAAESTVEAIPVSIATDTAIEAAATAAAAEARNQAQSARVAYESAIAVLETNPGQSGAGLSEAYFGLGNTLQTLEEPEEAVEAFGNAMQALRISNGLTDLQQLPILEAQLLSLEAQENWEEVDATRHLTYYIAMKMLPPGDALRYEALLDLARWKSKAAQEVLLPEYLATHNDSAILYINEIKLVEGIDYYEGKNIQLGQMYLELAAVELQEARNKFDLPLSAYQTTGQRSISRIECVLVRTRDGGAMQVCNNIETPNMEFYIGPSIKKNQEISGHLNKMKDGVLQAFDLLQKESVEIEQRDVLLAEMHRLTTLYNEFMVTNSNTYSNASINARN